MKCETEKPEPIGMARLKEIVEKMTKTKEALSLLQTAVGILEKIEYGRYSCDRLDSVTWRTADALLLLGKACEEKWPRGETPGINVKTGRGARLQDY